MRIVKSFYGIEGETRFNDTPIQSKFSTNYVQTVSESSLLRGCNSNRIDRKKGVVTPNNIVFDYDPKTFHIPFQTSEDLIPYMECFYGDAYTHFEEIRNGVFRVWIQSVLTLIFDGPDELGLIWKLSI